MTDTQNTVTNEYAEQVDRMTEATLVVFDAAVDQGGVEESAAIAGMMNAAAEATAEFMHSNDMDDSEIKLSLENLVTMFVSTVANTMRSIEEACQGNEGEGKVTCTCKNCGCKA